MTHGTRRLGPRRRAFHVGHFVGHMLVCLCGSLTVKVLLDVLLDLPRYAGHPTQVEVVTMFWDASVHGASLSMAYGLGGSLKEMWLELNLFYICPSIGVCWSFSQTFRFD